MLKKYRCKVKPLLYGGSFDWHFTEEGLAHNLNRSKILDKWFYFFANNPNEPIIVWNKTKSHWKDFALRLDPGTNRCIGVAIRNSDALIDGIVITESDRFPPDVKCLDLIDTADFEMIGDDRLSKKDPCIKWALGTDTNLHGFIWVIDVLRWIKQNLKYQWVLEYNGKRYKLNSSRIMYMFPRKVGGIVRVEDFNNFQEAIHSLFFQVAQTENITIPKF